MHFYRNVFLRTGYRDSIKQAHMALRTDFEEKLARSPRVKAILLTPEKKML